MRILFMFLLLFFTAASFGEGPVSADLSSKYTPYLSHATAGKVTVNFFTDKPQTVFVDFRVVGEKNGSAAMISSAVRCVMIQPNTL